MSSCSYSRHGPLPPYGGRAASVSFPVRAASPPGARGGACGLPGRGSAPLSASRALQTRSDARWTSRWRASCGGSVVGASRTKARRMFAAVSNGDMVLASDRERGRTVILRARSVNFALYVASLSRRGASLCILGGWSSIWRERRKKRLRFLFVVQCQSRVTC